MTRDEIVRMAMDAFLLDKVDCSDDYFIRADADIPEIERFAELAAAAERERCAKICDAIERRKWETLRDGGKMSGVSAKDCAAIIRWMR